MLRRITWLAALMIGAAPPASAADVSLAQFGALRAADLRVAAVGYRLVTANAALCRDRQPAIGVSLQALDQYGPSTRAAADAAFGFETMVAVEAVVPGGPAARAGIEAGDSLVAVAGVQLPAKLVGSPQPGTPATRNAVEQRIADQSPTRPLPVTVRRGGQDLTVVVQPVPACRTGVELVLDDGWTADSNGDRIRIGGNYVDRFDDEELAVVMAHELAHTVLRHRVRLDAAQVSRGALAGFGRNGRLIRQTEDEADQLSVILLYNAGYDPNAAFRFWIKPRVPDGGLFRDRTHRSATARAERIRAAISAIPQGAARPVLPAMLASRDQPLR